MLSPVTTERSAQTDKHEYWDKYYGTARGWLSTQTVPSQFAVFCLGELSHNARMNTLVDIASGDGRDSIFFARSGLNVIAIDKSAQAVDLINRNKVQNLTAVNADILRDMGELKVPVNGPIAYYARFFIHTLNNKELDTFFKNISSYISENDLLFIEYRNHRDASLTKVTEPHFRAFYPSKSVRNLAQKCGLSCLYEVEGTGLAKWKEDDASVSRQIFTKRNN